MPYYERRGFGPKTEQIDMHKAYERARKLLERDRIDIKKFVHYDKATIAHDIEFVRKREAQFKMDSNAESIQAQETATILEAITNEEIELDDWLGPEASTITPSRYDDIVNGMDSIVCYQHEGERDTHLGLAIDVTFSPEGIQEKLERNRKDIENHTLAEIKYFASPDPENPDEYIYVRSLKVPRVVIGVEKKVAQDLAYVWLEKDKKALKKHPIQYVIGREIIDQLVFGEQYARSRNANDIAAVYKQVRMVVEKNLQKKEGGIWKKERDYGAEADAMGILKNDKVLNLIEDYLHHIRALEIHGLPY